ncbi:hypothetical protein [Rhizobium anhuiense]|uniref:hypothetical protein n=1 Tax=Rhizobium anhuiense TaxID=1184720 RepID=UPI0015CEFC81|nr:hypothetical protein [Rhizobium anhuiense]
MTNADNWALAHFSRTLEEPFDDKVTAEDVEVCKPDPQVFAYARGRNSAHGYRLKDYLHVAQSQFHDIVAKRLGYQVCWIERRQGQEGFGGTTSLPSHSSSRRWRAADSQAAAVLAGIGGRRSRLLSTGGSQFVGTWSRGRRHVAVWNPQPHYP